MKTHNHVSVGTAVKPEPALVARVTRGEPVPQVQSAGKPKAQKGAVAIEFAAVFVVFFMVFYAIVGYTVPLLMLFKFNELSAEGARAAVAAEQDAQWEARVEMRITEVLNRSWLPADWRRPCYADSYFRIQPDALDPNRRLLEVCMQYPYIERPIIPILRLPGGINVPGVPDVLRGEASIRL